MRGRDRHAVRDGAGADDSQQQGLAPVVDIYLVPAFSASLRSKGRKPLAWSQFHGGAHRLPFRLGTVQKRPVAVAVPVGLSDLLPGKPHRRHLGS